MNSSDDSKADALATEVERRRRVCEMMITMHSTLRDRYATSAMFIDLLIFLSAIVIAALTFVDPNIVARISWSADSARIAIGVIAIVTVFASVVTWRVNWKGRADAHDRAAYAYSKIMFRIRDINSDTDLREIERVLMQYEEIGMSTISVPDSKFLSLKSRYLKKVQLSRMLDRTPGAFLPLVSLRLKLRHTSRAMKDVAGGKCKD